MPITKGFQTIVDEAMAKVTTSASSESLELVCEFKDWQAAWVVQIAPTSGNFCHLALSALA